VLLLRYLCGVLRWIERAVGLSRLFLNASFGTLCHLQSLFVDRSGVSSSSWSAHCCALVVLSKMLGRNLPFVSLLILAAKFWANYRGNAFFRMKKPPKISEPTTTQGEWYLECADMCTGHRRGVRALVVHTHQAQKKHYIYGHYHRT